MRFVLDMENYPDYNLVMLREVGSGRTEYWEQYPGHPFDTEALRAALTKGTLISFNGNKYDIPLLRMALVGATCAMIKKASDLIILRDTPPWKIEKQFDSSQVELDHIDIMEPTPGVMTSLKTYAGRIHVPTMQDLPIHPDSSISPEQRKQLIDYCANDCCVTEALYLKVEERIKLREQMSGQYGIDLRSKSDAQIAEAVIKHEVERISGKQVQRPTVAPGTVYRYKSPGFIKFQTPPLQAVHAKVKAANYVVAENGSVDLPPELADLKITIGSSTYQMGIGGLHSTEKSTAHAEDEETCLVDFDVASYYPNIIIRCGLFPAHLGEGFVEAYKQILARRLEAKHSGDKVTNESLKIVLNGSFGKFGSKYSILYSPNLLIQTTLTGQLALLQLIESLELAGVSVISANTDGIVVKCPRRLRAEAEAIVKIWEWFSCFEMESGDVARLYSKDVNNYILIKPNGKTKCKGLYAEAGLMKNPTAQASTDAVLTYLAKGVAIADTLRAETDIRKFITVRSVKGGGHQNGQFLGKAVRWYYSTACRGMTINYVTNGNKVAKSDGARAIPVMPTTLPDDIDYDVYAAEAEEILTVIGAKQ